MLSVSTLMDWWHVCCNERIIVYLQAACITWVTSSKNNTAAHTSLQPNTGCGCGCGCGWLSWRITEELETKLHDRLLTNSETDFKKKSNQAYTEPLNTNGSPPSAYGALHQPIRNRQQAAQLHHGHRGVTGHGPFATTLPCRHGTSRGHQLNGVTMGHSHNGQLLSMTENLYY